MLFTARLLAPLAVMLFFGGCRSIEAVTSSPGVVPGHSGVEASLGADQLRLSPRQIVGRVIAVDAQRGFAFIAISSEAASLGLAPESDLLTRTDDLRETGRLRASRYTRGRTLGAAIVSGQPSAGDEVVFERR